MYIPTNTLISETGLTNCGTVVLDTYPTWTDSTTTYGVAYNNDYISISKDLSEEIRKLGYNLNMVADVFSEFCERLIDLHEDMRLDEAFHNSDDLDDFLKEFIVNNKKN